MPEKWDILLGLSENRKNRDEFYVCKGLELKLTTPGKELYPNRLVKLCVLLQQSMEEEYLSISLRLRTKCYI